MTIPADTPTERPQARTPQHEQTSGEGDVPAGGRAMRFGAMAPAAELLPQVLPSERLGSTGVMVPELRPAIRQIANVPNVATVVGALAYPVLILAAAAWLGHPLAYVGATILLGSAFARLAILTHEAAHRLLFSVRPLNDFVGRWLLGNIAMIPFSIYRRAHFAHHREEFGPNEPDLGLYADYPVSPQSFRRKLRRDLTGPSGWANLKPLLLAMRRPASARIAAPILLTQAAIFGLCLAIGYPWLFIVWIGAWLTSWRFLNRLRAIAEHGGMRADKDRRATTHVVAQSRLASFWIAPYNTGYHLAHHVDMGVPWRNLPRYHGELVAAGYVPDALTWPSYRELWRALRTPAAPASSGA